MAAIRKAWIVTTHSPAQIYSGYSSLVRGQDLVVAVDDGLSRLHDLQITPDILIGDLDSLSPQLLEHYPDLPRKVYSIDKNSTDTELAIEWCLAQGAEEIVICNDLGGRFDHALALVQNLAYLHNLHVPACIESDKQRIFFLTEQSILSDCQGCWLTLLAWENVAVFRSSQGLAYPLEGIELNALHPRGVSNRILTDRAEIELACGQVLAILSKNI